MRAARCARCRRWDVARSSRSVAVVVLIGKTARKISRVAVDAAGRVRALGAHLSASLGVEGVHRRALLLVQLRLADEVEVGIRRRPSRDVSVSGGARSGAGGIRSFASTRRGGGATRRGGGATRRARRRTTRDGVRDPRRHDAPSGRHRSRRSRARRRCETTPGGELSLHSSSRRHPRWRSPEPPDLRDILDPHCVPIRTHQNRRVFMNTFQSV